MESGLEDPADGDAFVVDELEEAVGGAGADFVGEWVEVEDWVDDGGVFGDGVDDEVDFGGGDTGWEGVDDGLRHGGRGDVMGIVGRGHG